MRSDKVGTARSGALLTCAYGEPWLGPHPLCQAELARACGVPISEVLLPDFSNYAKEVTHEAIEPLSDAPRPGWLF